MKVVEQLFSHFTVLASGSSGNASLLEANGFGVLIDCGLHPRALTARLRTIGAGWDRIHAVILTHTHGDHWKDLTLADLRSRGIPLYAHAEQFEQLNLISPAFSSLRAANLTRTYANGTVLELSPGLSVCPVRVSHDAAPTFAFRFDYRDSESPGLAWSVGYASDLGCASEDLINAFAGVDVLALEFNHDEALERKSRRPAELVARVLGDEGHLSNWQAALVARAIAARSGPGFPSHLVLLHLSRECNRPDLALAAARAAFADLNASAQVIAAGQNDPTRSINLIRHPDFERRNELRTVPIPVPSYPAPQIRQPLLPGFEPSPVS